VTTLDHKAVTLSVKDLAVCLKPQKITPSPFTDRRIFFAGIGGSGMSGLASMLINYGARVSGSDSSPSTVTRRLAERGAAISTSEGPEAIPEGTELVVCSAAIKADHPLMQEANRRGIQTIKYAQMLGRVMAVKHGVAIAGTHGKSTTTALTAHVLLASGRDPSFVVGATSNQLGGSSRSGGSEFFVVEACEYDRSFHNLQPKIGVVLNIEEDHLDYYKDIGEIVDSFGVFMSQVDSGGVVLTSATDPNCLKAAKHAKARVETYGIDVPADWQATSIRRFQGKAHFAVLYKGKRMGRLTLSIAGRHNVGNAIVAAAIATHCGVPWELIAKGIESFVGVDRRSQLLGDFGGIKVVDDYGHHPTEIRATLLALREHYQPQRLICIFQPHQHSRTRFLLDDFARSFQHADVAIVPDIYFVRDSETDRTAVNAAMLVDRIRAAGRDALYIPDFVEIVGRVQAIARPGDLIVSMGAGPVWEVTHELVRRFSARGATERPAGEVHVV
jgi:UDP-N-acetylmuramate--alanine ligase